MAGDDILDILATSRTIAVVGLSDKPHRTSHSIAAYLQGQGYRIIPVNPTIAETLGERAYPSLRDLPGPVDVVLIFRRSELVPPVVDDAIAIGAPVVWMQSGIAHEESAARARAAGARVVMDACMGAIHRSLRAAGRI